MALWIQGMPLGRKFKAIVCHDGIYNLHAMIGSDVAGGTAEFNGSLWPWENWNEVERFSPSRADLTKNWATPMLVIHSEKDFRCITSDGIAAFHVAQKHGIPSQFLHFPDENHWVLKHENSLLWHETVFNFINKYSGIANKRTTIPDTNVSEVPKPAGSSQTSQTPIIQPPRIASCLEGLSLENNRKQTQAKASEDEFWTPELDIKLLVARAQFMTWDRICEFHFPSKTAAFCKARYLKLVADGRLVL